MKDEDRSRDDLLAELRRLRSRVAELESGPDDGGHAGDSLEHQYHELIHENRDGYARLNMDGSFVLCNPAYCAMLGYTQEELRGKAYADITPEKWRATDETGMKQVLEEGSCDRYEKEYRRRDGTTFPVELQSYLIRDADGNATGMWSFVRDITELKQFEKALLLSQERYAKAQAMGHTGNWEYDPLTEHFWASREAKRIYGFAPDSDAFTTDKVERCIPDRKQVHQALVDLLEGDKPYDLEFDILTHDKGIRRTIHSIAELARDAEGKPVKITGVIRDITRQKEAERAMAAQYNLLRVAGETVRFGGWSVNLKTMQNTWSDVVAEIHGEPPGFAPLVNEGIAYYAPEWRDRITDVFTRCAEEGISYDEELEIIARSGNRVWVRTVGQAVIDEKGAIVRVEGSFQDITERKQAEARLLESEKFAAIGRVSSGIAHEINNPLAAIRSSTELIRRTVEGDGGAMPDAAPRLLERVDKVLRNVDRCKGVVESLLGYARRGTGDYQPVNVVQALRDALSAVRESAGDAGERMLRIAEPPTMESLLATPTAGGGMDRAPADGEEMTFPVRARPGQFEQVFRNLLMNALHATAASGNVFVSYRTVDGGIEVSVADTGEGMAEPDIPRMFEPFFTTKQPGEGTGLGLYMTRRIVETAGGRIACESRAGVGTIIRVWLPGFSEEIRSPESV